MYVSRALVTALCLAALLALFGLSAAGGEGGDDGDIILFDLVNTAACEWDGTGDPEIAYTVVYPDGQAAGSGGGGGDLDLFDIVWNGVCNGAGAPTWADVVDDLTLFDSPGGTPAVLFDLVDTVVYDGSGNPIQKLTTAGIESPEGDLLCTFEANGIFHELQDRRGTVLFSALGPWVFEGRPALDGLPAVDQHRELTMRLFVSFDGASAVGGLAQTGPLWATASEPLDRARAERKLIVTALLAGNCGSPGL